MSKFRAQPLWLRVLLIAAAIVAAYLVIGFIFIGSAFFTVTPAHASVTAQASDPTTINWPKKWSAKKRQWYALNIIGIGGPVIEETTERHIATSSKYGCDEIKNKRKKKNAFGKQIWATYTWVNRCRYGKGGSKLKATPGAARCDVNPYSAAWGVKCDPADKWLRDAVDFGGNPQRRAWTETFRVAWVPLRVGELTSDTWCSTTMVKAEPKPNHSRSGSCELGPWDF